MITVTVSLTLTVNDVPTAAPLTFPSSIMAAMTPEFKPTITKTLMKNSCSEKD